MMRKSEIFKGSFMQTTKPSGVGIVEKLGIKLGIVLMKLNLSTANCVAGKVMTVATNHVPSSFVSGVTEAVTLLASADCQMSQYDITVVTMVSYFTIFIFHSYNPYAIGHVRRKCLAGNFQKHVGFGEVICLTCGVQDHLD